MIRYSEAPLAYGLTRGMARAAGVDVIGAVTEGWLSRQELADMVETCTRCGQSGRCRPWLSVQSQVTALPGFCANKPAIEALRG